MHYKSLILPVFIMLNFMMCNTNDTNTQASDNWSVWSFAKIGIASAIGLHGIYHLRSARYHKAKSKEYEGQYHDKMYEHNKNVINACRSPLSLVCKTFNHEVKQGKKEYCITGIQKIPPSIFQQNILQDHFPKLTPEDMIRKLRVKGLLFWRAWDARTLEPAGFVGDSFSRQQIDLQGDFTILDPIKERRFRDNIKKIRDQKFNKIYYRQVFHNDEEKRHWDHLCFVTYPLSMMLISACLHNYNSILIKTIFFS